MWKQFDMTIIKLTFNFTFSIFSKHIRHLHHTMLPNIKKNEPTAKAKLAVTKRALLFAERKEERIQTMPPPADAVWKGKSRQISSKKRAASLVLSNIIY